MKNNLFKKFLALFLTGTMLGAVGCKDYDDDIDSINKRLDGMDVTVADLQTQITNVKNSIPTLDELNTKVAALTSDLAGVKTDITSINSKITAIGDVQAKLNALKSDLQTYVNGQIQSSEQTLRKEIATKATAADIKAAVDALSKEITKQISDVASTVTSLASKVDSNETAQNASLTALREELQKAMQEIAKLQGQIEALPDTSEDISKLQAAIEDLQNNTVIKNLQEQIDALKNAPTPEIPDYTETFAEIEKRFESLEGLTHLDMAAVSAEIGSQIEDLKKSDWVSTSMSGAIASYLEVNKYKTYADTEDAVISALTKKIDAEGTDFVDALTALIGQKQLTNDEINEAIKGYKTETADLINKLTSRVAELENRIQSLVWVPKTLEQAQTNSIMFKSVPYITLTNPKDNKDSKNIYLAEADGQSAELTFTVSPASMCKKIQDGATLSIETEKLLKTRAEGAAPVFTISGDPTFDLEKGKITLKVATDYLFGKEENGKLYTPAIALKITMSSSVEGKSGLEYMSPFIAADFDKADGIKASDLVFAVKGEDNKYTEVNNVYETELLYTAENKDLIFLDNVKLYYKDGENYTEPSELWPLFPEAIRTPEQVDKKDVKAHLVGSDANKANYNLENVNKFAITKSATALIGDVVSSGNFGFKLQSGKYELSLGTLRHEVTITPVNTKLEVPAQAFTWKYEKAEYATNEISVGGKLKAAVYNELKTATETVVLKGKDKDGKDIKIAVDGIKIDYTTTPSEDSDAQKLKLTITDNQNVFIANGDYTVQADYELADQTTVTVLIPVTVTGMPQLAAYEIPAKVFTYDGNMTYTLLEPSEQEIKDGKDVANLIWKAYSTTLKDCFTEAQFTAMLKAAQMEQNDAKNDKKEVVASLTNNSFQNIDVTFANTDEATYKPGLTFTNGKIVVKVTSTVSMKKPVVSLVPNKEYFIGETSKTVANTTLSSAGYKVQPKALSGAYSKSPATPETATIVYALNYTDKQLEAMKKELAKALDKQENEVTMPSIQNNILDWGDYNKRTLKLKASIVLNNAELAHTEFEVLIDDPIADQAISQKKDAKGKLVEAIIYEEDNPATLSIADYLVLNIINKENVFDAANADVNSILGGKATYTVVSGSDLVSVSKDDGIVTFTPDGGLKLQKDITIKVKVSYSYLYDEGTSKTCEEITVTVKPGAAK